jgi:hypothetical protein
MPKIVDYPRASLRRALGLAEIVDNLGGECSDITAADQMGNKVGGAFRSLIGAAGKYGLVSYSKGQIKTEPFYIEYKLAYTEELKTEALRRAFLNVPLFQQLAQRLSGKPLPEAYFEKLMMKEYQVPQEIASRVAGYFTEGAKDVGLLGADGILANPSSSVALPSDFPIVDSAPTGPTGPSMPIEHRFVGGGSMSAGGSGAMGHGTVVGGSVSTLVATNFNVRITGPGIDSTITIKEVDDLDIVEAMLKKVRRLVIAQGEAEGKSGG